jgi:hypothetical protein
MACMTDMHAEGWHLGEVWQGADVIQVEVCHHHRVDHTGVISVGGKQREIGEPAATTAWGTAGCTFKHNPADIAYRRSSL